MIYQDKLITLTGVAIGSETATIQLTPRSYRDDGIDITCAVKLLEYQFCVTTFFYGYNCELFVREAKDVNLARANRAHLFNYDGTLLVELINDGGTTFLSLAYKSVLPEAPDNNRLQTLRSASQVGSANVLGSRFSISFMAIHNHLEEIGDWLAGILNDHHVSTANPYPH